MKVYPSQVRDWSVESQHVRPSHLYDLEGADSELDIFLLILFFPFRLIWEFFTTLL